MKFGPVPIADSEGLILGHTVRVDGFTFKKGHRLTRADLATLKNAGLSDITGARLEPGDVVEDEAAAEIAGLIAGAGLKLTAARTGRCNVEAACPGLVRIDAARITAANALSETVTIATLADNAVARGGQIVATVKIIPYAIDAAVMSAVRGILTSPALDLAPFKSLRTAVISTLTHALKDSVVASTEDITQARVEALEGTVMGRERVAHEVQAVSNSVRRAIMQGAQQILIAGASATADREDVVPAAIAAAGGVIDHFGMPVDPGNLLVLAHVGDVPVLVLPGCARSPKLNGADWVMSRIAAGLTVTAKDIMAMGVGGLLVDTPVRPLPRREAVKPAEIATPRIAAIVLAAGRSSRMGPRNKLLMEIGGKPLVRRTVESVLNAGLAAVVVVTGHEQVAVEGALHGLSVTRRHNPRYAEGLSTSLRVGLDALPPDIDGALVVLGDMPDLSPEHLRRLIAGFDLGAGRAIGVPVHRGKRGNPVLWGRGFFDDMRAVAGDVGAKALIGANESLVYEVEFEDTGVVTDLDTPEEWTEYVKRSSGEGPSGGP